MGQIERIFWPLLLLLCSGVAHAQAPTVTIDAPADGSSFAIGTDVSFQGAATDAEDGTLTASLSWTSSIDNSIGSGGSFSTTSLSAGTHTITASVTDSDSNLGSSSITVTITDDAPLVVISAPANNSTFAIGTNIGFLGSATDTEDGTLTTSLSWTSSINGSIGSGGSFSTTGLSEGTHTITASVTDSDSNLGSSSITVTITNDAPSVSISSPSNGASFPIGTNVSFQGTATDTEDGTLTTSLSWTSSINGSIGSGGSFSTTSLSAGTHTITASVTDSDSNPGTSSITVTITNNAPVVNITSPGDGASFAIGTNISFQASGSDVEDNNGQITNSISWTSSIDGPIGSGGNFNRSTLSAGTHTITASVTDSDGNPGTDSVTITVTNGTPTVNITQPANGSSFAFGANINFVATATDAEDGNLASSIGWTSSLDGSIGSGGSISVNDLSVGTHTITASVTDSDSNTSSDSITVTISNNAPTVTITAPSNGASFAAGATVNFVANATDAEDNNVTLTAAIAWSSSLDGALGTGGSISVSDLSVGNHTITASVTDSDGGSDSDSISVSISNNAPTVTITSPSNGASFAAGTNVNFVATATDAEDGNLASSVNWSSSLDGVLGTGGSINVSDLSIGSHTITASVTDSDGGSGSDSISVSVTNNAPTADSQSVSTDEDTSLPIELTASDVEDDPLTFSIVSQPSNGTLTGTPPNVTYTPNADYNGSDSFTFRANDGNSNSNTATVTITINPVNDAPAFVGVLPPGLTTPEDTTLTIPVSALDIADPDSDPASFVLTLDPVIPPDANYTLAGPASITPAENFNGDISVRATVSDGQVDSAPFLIPITVTAENDLPVLEAEIGPQTAIESSLFELNVFSNFSDSDGDTLTFSATGLPVSGRLTIDPVTGVISGTPTVEDARDNDPYIVTVTATDPSLTSVSDEFELTVSALDRANLALSIGVTPESGLPNEQLTWTFTASNPIGPAPGENVELTGSFVGNGLSVAAQGGASCSITLQTGRAEFSCTLGALPVGATTSINFTTTASEATEVVAFGTAAGALAVPIDPNISDNSAVRAVGVAQSFSDGAVQFLGNATILSVASGDFDGDGTTDLVVGTAAGQPVQVYLGDEARESCGCQRDFVATPISIPDTGANQGVAVADFDNDGNLDFVVANGAGQPDAVYRNTGAANFVLAALLAPSNGRDVAVGDFNNDGNPDIAIAATSPNPVYFGDGAGGFGAGILLGDVESFDVAVGRFDNDLFDDLVFANVGTDSQVWLNNGGTGFTPGVALAIGDAISVAAADLNADNLDDIVFGRISGGSGDVPANPVLLNQGGGTFSATPQLLGISPTVDVLIGDVSDDGQPDLVFVNQSGVHQIWTANAGNFVLHAEQIIDIGARAGALAELGFADSGDPGGADLALGGALGAGAAVYLNDSAGNLGLGDAVAPVITLNGESVVNVPSGSAYNDAGATAADSIDGDISGSIVVSNPVNTAIVGAYTVTYNVQDTAGNAAVEVTRTVNVTAATGRGGGGGGALGFGVLAMLLAAQLLIRLQGGLVAKRIRIKKA